MPCMSIKTPITAAMSATFMEPVYRVPSRRWYSEYHMSESSTFAKPFSSQDDTASDPARLAQLEFHVKSGDYFPMLATVLCALEEGVKACQDGVGHAADFMDHEVLQAFRK